MPIERWSVISRNGEAGWCGRRKHQVVSHRGSLFLLGGFTSGGTIGAGQGPNANLHDVWKSTEGAAWVRLVERAQWSGRDGHAAVAHNGAIYLMGGTQDPRSNFSDVWRSVNGRRWDMVCRQAPWQGRWQHAALSYQGYIFVVGGWRDGPGYLSDVWRSADGVRWTQTCSNAPWGGRMFHSMVEANGAMYLLGGCNRGEKLNDAWVSTDGRDWNLVTHDCQWSPRSGHAAICFENSLYVIGGEGTNNDKLKDVWRSEDGAHWTRIEDDVRVARQGHAAVVHHGKVLVLGGVAEGTVFMNDCLVGLSAAQIAAGALREHRSRPTPVAATTASISPSSTGGPAAPPPPPSAPATAAPAAAPGAGAVIPGTLVIDGASLQRSSAGQDGGGAAAMVSGGGGGVVGGGVFSRRPSNSAGRQQSVEDDLWGWFGDDRPPPETTLHESLGGGREGVGAAAGAAAGVGGGSGGGGGGLWPKESTEVTVSTLALTERLAKLSAGRALLDRVRADTRSLASVVSYAARSVFSGLVIGGGGDDGGPDGSTAVSGGVSSPAPTPRAVQFSEGPPTEHRSPRRARPAAAHTGSEPTAAATATATPAPEAGGNGDEERKEIMAADEEGGGRAGALRRRVVLARAELEGLQGEIRRLVREAEAGGGDAGLREEARARVAPLVERRAVLARAARTDARRMAERLQEISEAQQSTQSNVDAAMREVERRARKAGGRVWALIRGHSRQHSSDNAADNDDIGDDDDEESIPLHGDDADAQGAGGGGLGGGMFSSGQGGGGNDAAPPEWVLSRLELMRMRRRGSFLDGDELGPVRMAGRNAEEPLARGAGGSGDEVITAESFGNLARLASAEGDEDRRDTDEAVAVLREMMEQHSAALARLAGWMFQAASPADAAGFINTGTSGTSNGSSVVVAAWGGEPSAAAAPPEDRAGVTVAGSSSSTSIPPSPPLGTEGSPESSAVELGEEDGVRAMLELSRESDVLEGRVKRERFRAHRAADEEIHRTPELYKEACALGNALILKGHDFLSQVLADAGRDSAEASIMAEEAGAWAATVADLADGEELAARGQALKAKIEELKNSVLDQEDAIVDSQGALVKGRRRGASSQELEALQVRLAATERGARRARRASKKAAAAAATLAHGLSPEIALDLPEALNPLAGRQQVVQDVSIAGIDLPLRRLKDYDNLRAMEDEGSTGGGQGRHRIFLAEYDDETVVLKGYALVNALQRHSLERELHILDRVRHGAIIRAGAIVEDDAGSDNPIPMLYIEFPYCAQGNLRQWLQARPRPPWELQGAFRQVMCAVMHLHDVGVIHKDIKPGNILVHADGRFLLADFDVSKDTLGANATGAGAGGLRGPDGGGDSGSGNIIPMAAGMGGYRGEMEAETTRTSLAGTSGFMAPEVESGTPSSLASDMYSLGAVLFHMHFPDHPTGPLPIMEEAAGGGGSGGDGGVALGTIPRSADAPTAGLLKALLAADPARRPRASDALQADYFRVSHVSRLQEDGALLEQTHKLEAVRELFRTVRDEARAGGPLKWTVRRDNRYLVPSVLELIKTGLAGSALRRPLKITFEGEAGVDEGGILSEMYTLLFEAMMLPRFGLFEDCESAPASSTPSPSARDPTELAFAPRFSGALTSSSSSSSSAANSTGGGHPLDDEDGRFRAYLDPVPGAEGPGGEEEGAVDADDGGDFEAQREAELLLVEGAAAGSGGGEGTGGGDGKGLSKMLPTARPGGYSDAQLGRYRAIGRAMVKCLLEGRRIGSRLAPSVFKFITGTDTTLRDLQDFDPQTFESLKWMLANTGMRDMGFDFDEVGLPDKGAVTDGNKAEYVSAKARLILVESRRPALEALEDGFARALRDLSPGAAGFMGLLSHADWRVLLCGEEHVSGPQVVAVLAWHGFPARSEVPTWIKSLLVSLPEDALRRFLIFVCGTPSLPAPAAGKVEITVRCQPRSAALPAAHTCFFQLDVPDYDRESVLRHKLLQAVNNTSSFDVV
eukprot:g6967.t1